MFYYLLSRAVKLIDIKKGVISLCVYIEMSHKKTMYLLTF